MDNIRIRASKEHIEKNGRGQVTGSLNEILLNGHDNSNWLAAVSVYMYLIERLLDLHMTSFLIDFRTFSPMVI
jgi:hypothetical protein